MLHFVDICKKTYKYASKTIKKVIKAEKDNFNYIRSTEIK